MGALTIERLKQALLDAGLEIYRAGATEIRVAERVRMHLMDSGVSVSAPSEPRVSMTVRSQRSDFPTLEAEALFHKVREALRSNAEARGFREVHAVARDITDPIDASHVLDVWHELTFAKEVPDLAALIEDVRWALGVPKCVNC